MVDTVNVNELNVRLSNLSLAKRRWLEQRLRASPGKGGPVAKKRPAIVQLQAGSGELPLYFINFGPFEIRLAQMIGIGHSIFGIEIPCPVSWRDAAANNETAALPTTEQLVAPFVAELSAHVRSSPCVLAGYSFQGVMAFEAAHQLQRLGVKVKVVMLVDTWLKNPPLLYKAWGKLRQDWIKALGAVSKRTFRCSSFADLSAQFDEQGPLPWALLHRLYHNARLSYHPRLLDCHGVLFRADPKGDEYQEYLRAFDGSLGWKDLFAKGLEIKLITGDHFTMDQESLARKMIEVIDRYSREKAVRSGSERQNDCFRSV
jgi:thioesterase domain-containing protein